MNQWIPIASLMASLVIAGVSAWWATSRARIASARDNSVLTEKVARIEDKELPRIEGTIKRAEDRFTSDVAEMLRRMERMEDHLRAGQKANEESQTQMLDMLKEVLER